MNKTASKKILVDFTTAKKGAWYDDHYTLVTSEGTSIGFEARVVDELPAEGEAGYIYLVPKDESNPEDTYEEWIWALQQDNTYGWEHIGSTSVNIEVDDEMSSTSENPVQNKVIKEYVDEAPAFKPFPASVNTTGTTEQFMNSILALHPEVGITYLGTVSLSDMPAGLLQEEVEVYVYSDYVVYCIMRSTDVSPYAWWCASYNYQGWRPVNTDTTYSNFVGATSQDAGSAGLVPAPTTSDTGKYLKGDGTWSTVSAGPTVVQTTGTSTTDVMSQNAVTSMVFADPSTLNSVLIAPNGGIALPQTYNVAIGRGALITGGSGRSVALGLDTRCAEQYTIALGAGAQATVRGQFDVSTGSYTTAGYNNSNYRLLTGLYDGQSAHDAATYGQLSTAIINGGTTAPTTSTVGAVGTLYSYVDTTGATPFPHMMACTEIDTTTDPNNPSYTWAEVGAGAITNLTNTQMNNIWNGE